MSQSHLTCCHIEESATTTEGNGLPFDGHKVLHDRYKRASPYKKRDLDNESGLSYHHFMQLFME